MFPTVMLGRVPHFSQFRWPVLDRQRMVGFKVITGEAEKQDRCRDPR